MRWNCRSQALRFLEIMAKNQDLPFLTVFLIMKSSLQNISITLLRFLLKLHEHRGDRIGEKSSCERFCKVPVPRIIAEVKWVMESFRCYDNSDVIATLVMTNFHLNTTVFAIFPNVCLWRRSLCSDLTLKNSLDPEKLYRATFICQDGLSCCNVALISFRLFRKNLGNLRDVFEQMVYRPPWQKISRTPMDKAMTLESHCRNRRNELL